MADRLRNQLVEFVTTGPLHGEFEQQRTLYFNEFDKPDDNDWEGVLDWFIFEWFDDGGASVIDHFLSANPRLTQDEQDILNEWQDTLNSVFQVRAISKDSLRLKDLDSGYNFDVCLIRPDSYKLFTKGQYVVTRLLPVGNDLLLSGVQYIMPDRESAVAWLELRNRIDELHSPEEVEKAIQESCNAFCQLFGSDELTVPPNKLLSTLRRFQSFLLNEYRNGSDGTTAAERYRAKLGRDLDIAELPEPPAPYTEAADVTILCDDFDGIVVLPDYSRFRRIFADDDPEKEVSDWKELVWAYIKNPDIPTVAFERVAEQHPGRVEKVMRSVLGNNKFNIEQMYTALLHYREPVEGLVELEDEPQLLDLFGGKTKKPSTAVSRRSVGRKAPASKARPKQKAGVKKSASPASKKGARSARSSTETGSSSSKPGTRPVARGSATSRKAPARRKS
jgi:hypothetical protein